MRSLASLDGPSAPRLVANSFPGRREGLPLEHLTGIQVHDHLSPLPEMRSSASVLFY